MSFTQPLTSTMGSRFAKSLTSGLGSTPEMSKVVPGRCWRTMGSTFCTRNTTLSMLGG